MKRTPEQVIKRFDTLKQGRGVWETHWQEVLDYTLPNVQDVLRKKTEGSKKGQMLFDNTATVACEMLAAALHGMLTNPNTQWFELMTRDNEINKNDDVRAYLQDLTETAHRILNNSNFQTEIHQFYLDLCTIGTAIMTIEPNDENIIHFSTKHISDCVMAENHLGKVEDVGRCFKWEAQQILQEFTKDAFGKAQDVDALIKSNEKELITKFSEDVIKAYKNQRADKFELIHSVYKEKLLADAGKPFLSQYVLKSKNEPKELRVNGYRRFPYLVSRWTKMSGETYGRSPAMSALPEAKTVNQMMKAVIKAAQKVVDPPTQGPDDGFLRPLKTAPGSHHYYRAGTPDRIEAIFKDINPRIGFELIRDRQAQIKAAFFVDKLNLPLGDRATTVEVHQRIEEQLRFMAPMLGRQYFEVLIPLIENLMDVMVDADAGSGEILGQIPPEIQDVSLSVQYTSPIARAQLVTQGQSMVRALEASAPFINIDQASSDVIDSVEAIRQNWKIYGAPQRVLKTTKELRAAQDARAEAQAELVQQQKEMATAETVSKIAPVMQG